MPMTIPLPRRLAPAAALLLAVLAASPAAAQDLRVRKNIDSLTADELATYVHAVDILRKRDPSRADSYHHFAELHDNFDNGLGCEHHNELFFPWHRELLLQFEQALRDADPPRTSNLTLPYWNWGLAPSGTGYPRAFEDTSSPLYTRTRRRTPRARYSEAQLLWVISQNDDWNAFAGSPITVDPSPGAFESPYHDAMHDGMGIPMNDPTTAAEDAIFWSYHAYIDLMWDRWQQEWKKPPTCGDCALRGLGASARVDSVVDIRRQLGYRYDWTPAPSPPSPPAGLKNARFAMVGLPAGLNAAEEQVRHRIFDVTIPAPGFRTAHLRIEDAQVPQQLAWSGRVYLYPATEELRPENRSFHERYYAGRMTLWSGHGSHSHGREDLAEVVDVYVNVTERLRQLSAERAGEAWKAAFVVEPRHSLTRAEQALLSEPVPDLRLDAAILRIEMVLDHDFARRTPR